MPGNRVGGLKTAAKIKARFGEDHYVKIGKIGGQNGHTGGFYVNRKLASEAGYIGGSVTGDKYKTRQSKKGSAL